MSNRHPKPGTGELKRTGVGLSHLIQRFWPFFWESKNPLAGSYFLNLLATMAMVLSPWPLKIIIDNVLGGEPLPNFLGALTLKVPPETMVISLAVASTVIAIIGVVSSAIARILDAQVREFMGLNLRDRLLCHLQTLPHLLRQSYSSGELVLRLVDDVNQLVKLFTQILPMIFRQGADFVVTFAVMFWIEPFLAGLSALVMIFFAFLVKGFAKPLKKASQLKRKCEGQTAGLAQEIIRGLPTIQVLGIEQTIRKRFLKINHKSFNAGLNELRVAVSMERILRIASGILVGLAIGGGGLLVLKNKITVGQLTVFSAYVIRILRPLEKMNEMATSVSRYVTRGELLIHLMDQISPVSDPINIGGKITFDKPVNGLLEFREVTFAYPLPEPGLIPEPTLRNLNLTLKPGQLAVLTGPSGGGKSTLLYLLLRFFDASSGQILLDNVVYDQIDLKSLRSQFSVMLQNTHLFAGSIRESLIPEDKKVDDAELWAALELVALDDHVHGLPGRLDAELREDGVNISGGQRARLSLARAFLLDRPILVLDEPLANVDADSQKIILNALDKIRSGRTCLVITHQLSILERADVVLQMEHGQIMEAPEMVARV